ncbi:MAG: DUF3617 family protein [Pseudomonadota bacterium]
MMLENKLMLFTLACSLGFAVSAQADTPNIEPGQWETTSNMTMEGPFPIPPQEDTSTQCITEEDIADGMAFMEDDETCQVTEKDIQRDSGRIVMVCDSGDAMKMTMQMDMKFEGDAMEGEMVGDMESPMGPMKMNMTMTSRRLGDC